MSGDDGGEQTRVTLGNLAGIGGFHWLTSGRGFVVWTLHEVHVFGLGGEHELAYAIDQPGELPLSVEDVRVLPGGALVVAQECGDGGRVRRHAAVIHVRGARVVGETDLDPWAGLFLFAATPLRDGRIVLALNEREHVEVRIQQCLREAAIRLRQRNTGLEWACWHDAQPTQLFASEFRVLRVHAPNAVEIAGSHACPNEWGCPVDNWAPSARELIWTDSWSTYRLRSPVSPSPLMNTGGVWTSWPAPHDDGPSDVHSLWIEHGVVLHASRFQVWTTDLGGDISGSWRWTDEGPVRPVPRRRVRRSDEFSDWSVPQRNEIFAARFTPDGTRAVITLAQRIIELDLATGETRRLFAMIDVPAAFDAANYGLRFADAKLLRSNLLAFDVVAMLEPRKSVVTVAPGRVHQRCPHSADLDGSPWPSEQQLSDVRYRELLPWVRKRTRSW